LISTIPLLCGDSDFEWAQFLIEKGVLDREVQEAKNQEFYEHYKAGTLDIHAFSRFSVEALVAPRPAPNSTPGMRNSWPPAFAP